MGRRGGREEEEEEEQRVGYETNGMMISFTDRERDRGGGRAGRWLLNQRGGVIKQTE